MAGMSEMVERVAKALSKADGHPAVLFDYYLEHARAAIEAMREPTDDMIRSGLAFPKLGFPFIDMKNAWEAAINEALKRSDAK